VLGDSIECGGAARRARFLEFCLSAKQGTASASGDDDEDAKWAAFAAVLRGAAETAAVAPLPGLRFAELAMGSAAGRSGLAKQGGYWWTCAARRLARHCVKASATVPEEEMSEMLERAVRTGEELRRELRRPSEEVERLGLVAVEARAAMWQVKACVVFLVLFVTGLQASWFGERREAAATTAATRRASEAMRELERGCEALFDKETRHGLLRDREELREQHRDMKTALQGLI
jgi:hypothetical protein